MALTELNLKVKKAKNIVGDDDDQDFENIEEEDTLEDEVEDDDEELDVELQEDEVEEDSEEAPKGDSDDDEDDDDEAEIEAAQNELSKRANDRVRSAVEGKNKARERLIAERKEKIDIQNRMISQQKTTVDTSKTFLKNHIDLLKKGLKQAHESSNHDETVELQEKLNKAQLDLSVFESWKEPDLLEFNEDDFKDLPEEKAEEIQPSDKFETAPKAVKTWAAKNPWFRNPKSEKDKERLQEAVLYSNVLESKGLKMDSPEFFEKIDKRLKALGLAEDTEDNVQSSKSSSDTGRKIVAKKKKIIQTVQSAQRGAASQNQSKNKITLTKAEQNMADLMGVSYRDYALEMKKIADAEKRGDRMVNIFDN